MGKDGPKPPYKQFNFKLYTDAEIEMTASFPRASAYARESPGTCLVVPVKIPMEAWWAEICLHPRGEQSNVSIESSFQPTLTLQRQGRENEKY